MQTTASNFSSFVTSSVDKRTGLLTSNIVIFNGTVNKLLGPSIDLTLAYDPLNSTVEYGYGKGWSLALSMVDFNSQIISLSTGETYNFKGISGDLELTDRKLLNLKASRDGDQYTVVHKGGLTEILESQLASENSYISKLITPQGKYITYTYQRIGITPEPVLKSIEDMYGNLLIDIQHVNDYEIKIFQYPNTPEERIITLSKPGGFLSFASLANKTDVGYWYDYDTDQLDHKLLYKIIDPLGAQLEVRYGYNTSGHQLPINSPQSYVPRVLQEYSGSTSNPRKTTIEYTYSNTNYLGGGSSLNWQSDHDNSYVQDADYQYYSIAKNIDTQHNIKTVYNRFHLVTLQEETNPENNSKVKNITEYYATASMIFDDQPRYFQMPKKSTLVYEVGGNSREEITKFKYDDYGNTIEITDPSGVITQNVYYDPAGENDTANGALCPAAYGEMACFLKSTTTLPASNTDYTDVFTSTTEYTYSNVDIWTLDDQDAFSKISTIKIDTERMSVIPQNSDVQELIDKKEYIYYSDDHQGDYINHPEFGQVHQMIYTYNQVSHLTYYLYEYDADYLQTTTTETLYYDDTNLDNDTSTSLIEKKHYRASKIGRVKKEVLYKGNTVTYENILTYDFENHILRRTNIDGDGVSRTYTKQLIFNYSDQKNAPKFKSTTGDGATIVTTDFKGNVSTTSINYKGLATTSSIKYFNNPEEEHIVSRTIYDDEDRIQEVQQYDYIDRQQLVSTTSYEYDWHDNAKTIVNNNNLTDKYNIINDYCENYIIEKFGNQIGTKNQFAYTKTYLNAHKAVDRVDKLDKNDNLVATTLYRYDGQTRLREVIFAAANFAGEEIAKERKVYIEYDNLNRPIRYTYGTVTDCLFDQDNKIITEIEYWSDSPGQLMKKTTVDGVVVAEKAYDNIFRVHENTKGNLRYVYNYDAPEVPISSILCPNDTNLFFEYDANKFFQGKEVNVADPEHPTYTINVTDFTDTYSPTKITTSDLQGVVSEKNYTYDPASDVVTDILIKQRGASDKSLNMSYSKTFETCHTINDAFSHDQVSTFLDDGKLNDVSYNGIDTSYTYDEYERVSVITTNTAEGSMTTAYTYNDFGNIQSITFTQGADVTKIEYEYDQVLSKLSRKETYKGSNLVLAEDYQYTYLNTLFSVNYTGDERYFPRDKYDNIIKSEIFEHDKLNNLRQVTTNFTNSEQNITTYSYDNAHFAQVSSIQHSHASYIPSQITLEYDAFGNVTYDGENHITYDEMARVSSINGKAVLYDESGKIIQIQSKDFYYDGDNLLNEESESLAIGYTSTASFFQNTDRRVSDSTNSYTLYKRDSKNTNVGDAADTINSYSAYGYNSHPTSPIGYNGDYEIDGLQLMGNGYRLYSPHLRKFYSPDSLSPGEGGVNPYTYNLGDPINRSDPTGHMSAAQGVGLGMAITGILVGIFTLGAGAAVSAGLIAAEGAIGALAATSTLAVASEVAGIASGALGIASSFVDEEEHPGLGIASDVLGTFSLVSAFGAQAVKGVTKQANKVTNKFSQGLSGRGAPEAGKRWASEDLNVNRGVDRQQEIDGARAYRRGGLPEGRSRSGSFQDIDKIHNLQTGGGPKMTKSSLEALRNDKKINAKDIAAMIPSRTETKWDPNKGGGRNQIRTGRNWEISDGNGGHFQVRIHTRDHKAMKKYPDSNSAKGPIVRIQHVPMDSNQAPLLLEEHFGETIINSKDKLPERDWSHSKRDANKTHIPVILD